MDANWIIRKRFVRALFRDIIVVFVIWAGLSSNVHAYDIVVGSNRLDSIDFHIGRVICRLVNANTDAMKCQPRVTTGSSYNLDNVQLGSLDMGIVRSDVHYRAIKKRGVFKFRDMTYENVRSLFSLHTTPFTLIASQKSNIKTLDDLLKKRVNIGPQRTTQHTIMNQLFRQKGWNANNFLMLEELPSSQSQDTLAFCHGRIQAIVYTMIHPNPIAGKLISRCKGELIPIDQPTIKRLIIDYPYYSSTRIQGSIYRSGSKPILTFGLKATLVASEALDNETAYQIVKLVFTNIKRFIKINPAFHDLTAEQMATDALSAPLHDGAKKFYTENGWM